jgi:uncharacterized protein YcbK (DUF882 family)
VSSVFTNYFARSLNTEPPKQLWNNIVPTLRIVEELCDSFGQTCYINSSYRSRAYNAKVGGESNSLHMAFKALDISFPGVSPSTVSARLKKWRSEGKFSGGIGTYATFVHIDTRGYNATW